MGSSARFTGLMFMLCRVVVACLVLMLGLWGCARLETPHAPATPAAKVSQSKAPAAQPPAAPATPPLSAEVKAPAAVSPVLPPKAKDPGGKLAKSSKSSKLTEPPKPLVVAPVQPAQIVFYRDAKFVGSALVYDIYEQNAKRASLQNGSFAKLSVAPGTHYFYLREARPGLPALAANAPTPQPMQVELHSGETLYIKGAIETGIMSGRPFLRVVSESEAKNSLSRLAELP